MHQKDFRSDEQKEADKDTSCEVSATEGIGSIARLQLPRMSVQALKEKEEEEKDRTEKSGFLAVRTRFIAV